MRIKNPTKTPWTISICGTEKQIPAGGSLELDSRFYRGVIHKRCNELECLRGNAGAWCGDPAHPGIYCGGQLPEAAIIEE